MRHKDLWYLSVLLGLSLPHVCTHSGFMVTGSCVLYLHGSLHSINMEGCNIFLEGTLVLQWYSDGIHYPVSRMFASWKIGEGRTIENHIICDGHRDVPFWQLRKGYDKNVQIKKLQYFTKIVQKTSNIISSNLTDIAKWNLNCYFVDKIKNINSGNTALSPCSVRNKHVKKTGSYMPGNRSDNPDVNQTISFGSPVSILVYKI